MMLSSEPMVIERGFLKWRLLPVCTFTGKPYFQGHRFAVFMEQWMKSWNVIPKTTVTIPYDKTESDLFN